MTRPVGKKGRSLRGGQNGKRETCIHLGGLSAKRKIKSLKEINRKFCWHTRRVQNTHFVRVYPLMAFRN